ncbi:MAG: DUF1501 domain-containing protein [Pirellulaceae bacterium]|nr:DUF1501 domain-containing protein [Pirellulaceae bacterium]
MAVSHEFSRRALLHGAMAGGAAFGGFGRLFAADSAAQASRQQKHVILLWMSGGPSQFETWDPKPGAPTGGPHLSIPTTIPGIHFDEFLPQLARLAERMVTIRSMTTKNGDHSAGSFLAQTGHEPSRVIAPPPHWLAMAAHELAPARGELPAFVNINREQDVQTNPGAGFLGPKYQQLYCPGNGAPPEDLPPPSVADLAALEAREALRERLAAGFRAGRDPRPLAAHDAIFRQMGSLVASSEIFDISREPESDQDRYGRTRFGRDCLLARRLVERGVPFVRVQHQNGLAWDKHRRAFDCQRHISAEFDTAAGALIDDLIARGLWEQTLVVCMGEFGRTPEIQGQGPPGRNHYTKNWALSFGGCGMKEGVVIGKTNADGTEIIDRPVTIHDLFCTFYTILGIDPHKELDFEGRPIPLVENKLGQPLREVL